VHILVIEDDPKIAAMLRKGCAGAGHTADVAQRGDEGLRRALENTYDIIILDLMLPVLDGFEVLRRLRAEGDATPVICLSARDAVRDRVRGLDLGADDYLTKPFSFSELLARTRAVLRRRSEPDAAAVDVSDLHLDFGARAIRRGDRPIELSPTEYALLECLARNHGSVVSRSMLLERVWGIKHDPATNVVDVHINRLRKKVDYAFEQRLIHTVRGVGYVLRSDEI